MKLRLRVLTPAELLDAERDARPLIRMNPPGALANAPLFQLWAVLECRDPAVIPAAAPVWREVPLEYNP